MEVRKIRVLKREIKEGWVCGLMESKKFENDLTGLFFLF